MYLIGIVKCQECLFKYMKYLTTSLRSVSETEKEVQQKIATVAEICKFVENNLNSEIVKHIQAIYLFIITGDQPGKWFLNLKTGQGSCGNGDPPHRPDVIFTLDRKYFVKLLTGQLTPPRAYMSGKVQISGSMRKAVKLNQLLAALRKKMVQK